MQLANPACGGGANAESLIEAQAVAVARHPVTVQVAEGARRDPRWRPLDDGEKHHAAAERGEKYWKNSGVVRLDECYWMKGVSGRSAG